MPAKTYAGKYKGPPRLDCYPAGEPGELTIWQDAPNEWALNCALNVEDATRAESPKGRGCRHSGRLSGTEENQPKTDQMDQTFGGCVVVMIPAMSRTVRSAPTKYQRFYKKNRFIWVNIGGRYEEIAQGTMGT